MSNGNYLRRLATKFKNKMKSFANTASDDITDGMTEEDWKKKLDSNDQDMD